MNRRLANSRCGTRQREGFLDKNVRPQWLSLVPCESFYNVILSTWLIRPTMDMEVDVIVRFSRKVSVFEGELYDRPNEIFKGE